MSEEEEMAKMVFERLFGTSPTVSSTALPEDLTESLHRPVDQRPS